MTSNPAARCSSPCRRWPTWLACAGSCLLAFFARSASAAPLDEYATRWAEQREVSGSWSLLRRDVVLAEGARGFVRGSSGQPITADTAFWICSNSKQFAAAAVLRLVEQGRLELAAPLTRYFPELNAAAVTRAGVTCSVEHVLSHRCGLVRDAGNAPESAGHLSDPKREARLLGAVNAETLAFEPGTKFLYSNLGYSLIGLLVQRASGKSYEQYLQEQFWGPLGMAHTGIRPREGIQLARGQTGAVFTWVDAADWLFFDAESIQALGAQGNIYSTPRDLAVWTQALHHGKVLQPTSYAELIRPRLEDYALGLQVSNESIGRLIHHDGALAPQGYSSQVAYLPEQDLAVVILTNRPLDAGHALSFAGALLRKASGQPENPPLSVEWQVRLLHSGIVVLQLFLLGWVLWMLRLRIRQPERLDRQNWWLSYHFFALMLGSELTEVPRTPLDPWLLGWAVLMLAGAYKARWWALPNWQRRPGLKSYLGLSLRSLSLLALVLYLGMPLVAVFAVLCVAEGLLWLVTTGTRRLEPGRPMSAR